MITVDTSGNPPIPGAWLIPLTRYGSPAHEGEHAVPRSTPIAHSEAGDEGILRFTARACRGDGPIGTYAKSYRTQRFSSRVPGFPLGREGGLNPHFQY